jgi:hypothetical protein
MSHDTDYSDLEAPDNYQVSSKFYQWAGALTAVGALGFIVMLSLGQPARAWRAYLIGWWFTLSLAVSGPFIIATQYLSHGSWGTSVRRIPEAFGSFLIPATILGIIALAGAEIIMPWLNYDAGELPHHVTHIIHLKDGYLNMTGLVIATVGGLVVMTGLYMVIRRNSLAQDDSGDPSLYTRNKWLSALFLVVFVTVFTNLSYYWLMSLEPTWFSHVWSVYCFAAMFQTGLALWAIVTIHMMRDDAFGDFAGEYQLHSIGQLVFAFTVFYAYIAFCQFMLIWYANIPEETAWFVHRINDVGYGFFIVLWLIKFIIPFFVLLPQSHKKNKQNFLYYTCWMLLVAQLYEVWYWVEFSPMSADPAAAPTIHLPWLEILVSLGFIGLFMLTVGWALSRANVIPTKDPFLHEALAHVGGHGDDDESDGH